MSPDGGSRTGAGRALSPDWSPTIGGGAHTPISKVNKKCVWRLPGSARGHMVKTAPVVQERDDHNSWHRQVYPCSIHCTIQEVTSLDKPWVHKSHTWGGSGIQADPAAGGGSPLHTSFRANEIVDREFLSVPSRLIAPRDNGAVPPCSVCLACECGEDEDFAVLRSRPHLRRVRSRK